MDALINPFKKGMIILWSGAIADIPGGWQICDGTNGSPNLKNVFVVGAGDSYVVDAVGGLANHSHGLTGVGHGHTLPAGGDIASGVNYSADTGVPNPSMGVDNADGRPPYYALAYIMKL